MLTITRKGSWTEPGGYVWNYYGDDENASIFYIIPRPQFSFDNRQRPVFRLVEYRTSDGSNGSGYCHLQVQLSVPQDVRDAIVADIRAKFGVTDPQIDPLRYNPGSMAGVEYPDPATPGEPVLVQVAPTLVGGNIASFLIDLDREGVKTFKDAFSGVTGALPVNYAVSVDSRMPAVKAVVTFDSQAAYRYEQQNKVDKNVWGDVTRREVTIRTTLQQSQAGSIQVDPGSPPPPPEVIEAARRWAQGTLEQLVNNAVNSVLASIPANQADRFTMDLVQSFREEYSESQVVPWLFAPADTLPSMPQLGFSFDEFFSVVDLRRFNVNVTMNLAFAKEAPAEDSTAIRSVDVTVTYPGLQDNTFTFDADNQAHLFETVWDPGAGGRYKIAYKVNYWRTGQPPLVMPAQDAEASIYTINPAAAALVEVEFNADNVPFVTTGAGYDFVQVEFWFQDLSGNNHPIVQNIQLDSSAKTGKVNSIYAVPRFNDYVYTLTYRKNDGSLLRLQPQTSNAAKIYINNPLKTTTLFLVLTKTANNGVDYALTDIAYNTGLDGPPVSISLQIPDPPDTGKTNLPITVTAVDTSQVVFYYSGIILFEDGNLLQIPDAVTNLKSIILNPNQFWFGINVRADLIDWSDPNLGMVSVDLTFEAPTGTGEQAVRVRRTITPPSPWTRASAPTQQKHVVVGFLHPVSEQAKYDAVITYAYTNGPAKTIELMNATSPVLAIPPKPESLQARKEALRIITEPIVRNRVARGRLRVAHPA